MTERMFEFTAQLWLYPGKAGWHFITLPTDVADAIEEIAGVRRGFGSVPVVVSVGSSTWKTSIFPDSNAASFVLPIKKDVRQREELEVDGAVAIRLELDSDRS